MGMVEEKKKTAEGEDDRIRRGKSLEMPSTGAPESMSHKKRKRFCRGLRKEKGKGQGKK